MPFSSGQSRWGSFQRGVQRAPIMSTAYVGISTSRAATTAGSASVFRSTANLSGFVSSSMTPTMSSHSFSSSSDILTYLRTHPDYQRLPPSTVDAIVAAVVAGLAVVGSVVLMIVSDGAATPLLISSLGLCSGTAGLQTGISGAIHRNFLWSDYAEAVGVSAGLTLITFGAGFSTGHIVGLALRGAELGATTVRAIGSVAGGIVGSGARTGSFLLIRRVEGRVVGAIELSLEAVQGLVGGATAGYLGARAVATWSAPSTAEAPLGNGFQDPVHTGRFEQTVIDVWHHPDVGRIGLIEGWQAAAPGTGGHSLMHIVHRHGDIFSALGFTQEHIQHVIANGGGSQYLRAMSDAFLNVVASPPIGITSISRGAVTYVWELDASGLQLQATISNDVWDYGARNIIQANLVRLSQNRIVPIHYSWLGR